LIDDKKTTFASIIFIATFMNLAERIESFITLSTQIKNMPDEAYLALCHEAKAHNGWFVKENIDLAFTGLQNYLQAEQLNKWLQQYDFQALIPKKIGVVMAGNIPLVGIHDFICVLLAGHHLQAKLSSQDSLLIKAIANLLIANNPKWAEKISFVDTLKDFDAVIATGSNNTAKHFAYYFAKYPHIIRQNRTSVAALQGLEEADDLLLLGQDVLQYYGLGCRNVSKVFIPEGYDLKKLCHALMPWEKVLDNHKYQHNYDYYKSIYLVNQTPHYDTGFLLLLENEQLFAPTSVLYYETYNSNVELYEKINQLKTNLQCVTSKNGWVPDSIPLGKAQQPNINDYADEIDTMQFLLTLPN
jgi:hypothetical protein